LNNTPDQNDNNDVIETDTIATKNENHPSWVKVLFFCGNKLLYVGLNIITYFTNRGIFALKAICTFNLILIGFVIAEWWFYQYMAYELIPQFFHNFQLNYLKNKAEGE